MFLDGKEGGPYWGKGSGAQAEVSRLRAIYKIVGSLITQLVKNPGDPSSIPGLGRSPGEGIGYPLQYSWASLVVQVVKNTPAIWETWVQSLDWEDPLEKETATHCSILAWRIPWTVWSVVSQRVGHD